MKCFGHVQLGGDPGADLGHAEEIISLSASLGKHWYPAGRDGGGGQGEGGLGSSA